MTLAYRLEAAANARHGQDAEQAEVEVWWLKERLAKAREDAKRWRRFASSPQTALMLGSPLNPNLKIVDWVVECNRLIDEKEAADGKA